MYKIGDKVETPLGIGIVVGKRVAMRHDDIIFEVEIKGIKIDFRNTQVTPYKSAHDKLLAMGYRISQTTCLTNSLYTIYEKEGSSITIIERKSGNAYKTRQEVNYELSRILTQYLEELEE